MKSSSTIILSYVLCIVTLVLASAIIFFVRRQLPARSLKHCQKLVDHERALLTMGFVAFAASLGLFFIQLYLRTVGQRFFRRFYDSGINDHDLNYDSQLVLKKVLVPLFWDGDFLLSLSIKIYTY